MNVFVFFSVLTFISHIYAYVPWEFNGTTPNINEIIIGRCLQFKLVSSQNRNPALYVDADCKKVWDLFNSSFSFKDSCQNESNYESLFNLVGFKKLLTDQALFWSGTRQIVHDYTAVQNYFFTLEDTFAGYIVNNLQWCGCKSCQGGINFNSCNKSCTNYALYSYWLKASKTFAENANGTAYVMVNGTTDSGLTAYFSKSYFGMVELPTMGQKKQVTQLVVIVVNNLETKPKEKCGQGSLINLVQDAYKVGINKVKCIDQPEDVMFLLCSKYPKAKQCLSMSNTTKIKSNRFFVLAFWSMVHYSSNFF
ncbi:ADP-ribosyl cyclase/cyclic ADP-ribose hydrolase-like isoform X1 [Hydra vulgaris]|uniref:ADP-ribosyl cyclase/cyclic ADP-ribose hydrolase-like isoform X1 n=1 Tax=Hydra vulgaris TaxID=6087 RepID=UPI0032E9C45B